MSGAATYGALLDALHGVAWPARGAVAPSSAGTHPSRVRGLAVEFTEYRPYRQGDDPGRLDWKLLARTDRAFLRISNERAVLPTLILLDATASMAYPVPGLDKWKQACRLTVGLAAVAWAAGDPVGIRAVGDGDRLRLRPTTRRDFVFELTAALDAVTPLGDRPLAPALRAESWPRRVVLISDFLSDEADLLAVARSLAVNGVDVYAVHVIANGELNPPASPFGAMDPERQDIRRVLGPETRDAYLRAFAAWRGEVADRWRAGGARYLAVRAEESAALAVRAMVRGTA